MKDPFARDFVITTTEHRSEQFDSEVAELFAFSCYTGMCNNDSVALVNYATLNPLRTRGGETDV